MNTCIIFTKFINTSGSAAFRHDVVGICSDGYDDLLPLPQLVEKLICEKVKDKQLHMVTKNKHWYLVNISGSGITKQNKNVKKNFPLRHKATNNISTPKKP